MLNNAMLMGRLTHDPELRQTNTGTSVCSFSVAVDRDYRPENGELETDFIDCVACRGKAEFISKYFKKGSSIVLNGRIQTRKWTDNDGNNRKATEISVENVYFGEPKKKDENVAPAAPARDINELAERYPQYVQVEDGEPF